jgi:hypothetical protein
MVNGNKQQLPGVAEGDHGGDHGRDPTAKVETELYVATPAAAQVEDGCGKNTTAWRAMVRFYGWQMGGSK